MLLAIDIGNTNIVLGLFLGEKLIHKFRLETSVQKSDEDYAIDIVELFLNNKIDCLKIASVIIVSVVPSLTNIIEKAVRKFYNGDALVVGKNLKLNIEINIKNKLYGWANKNGKLLEFDTLEEKFENGRRLFTIGATVDGELVAQGKGYNKKDASQVAAQLAVDKLGL